MSDPGVMPEGWVDQALLLLRGADLEVEAGFEAYVESGCDVLVAIDGGSCIDAAKRIAVLSGNGGRIADHEGLDRVTDPALLTTMPPDLSANTGLDALSHAIEAYVSKGASFLSDEHALAAIREIVTHLTASIDDPSDLIAREHIARASLRAGLAFTNALFGATHAISHQIGGALDLPLGLLDTMLLPHVMRFNAGVGRSDVDGFAENALKDVSITTDPRAVSKDDVRRICLAAN